MSVQENDILIRVSNVSKKYRRGHENVTALHDISLDIHKGELLAIVGPSGSGKTTLTHIIGGLTTSDTGSVEVDGQALKKGRDKMLSAYRNNEVGFVLQNFSLIPYYTALENVTIPLVIAKMAPRKRRALAKQYLKLVGLEKRIQQRANELSGGERQRVAIARALVNHPQIIIADEPTGSLDSARGNEIMTILETLSHKRGITVLMVTHDEALAARADRSIHIRDGRVVKETKYANR
ncbi:MAG TPA: ABC transporter ATP-binding protein [Candidatus Saccharimonadales bacterium]|nr:ABC transporter ATP-binding protein [Candidatus Saccharimonadales bacterium]